MRAGLPLFLGEPFKFIHLDGTHFPSSFGSELKEDGKEYTEYDEAAGNKELLKMYFEILKEKGLYNDATIIIMADHGNSTFNQNPIFLIKNSGETHNFIESKAEMSYEYLKNIWIEFANGRYVDEEFIRKQISRFGKRRFLFYMWDNSWNRSFMPGMEEMLCYGVAYDAKNLTFDGRTYLAENENHKYKLGQKLEFVNGGLACNYSVYGFSNQGNMMKEAKMSFDIEDEYDNLIVEIEPRQEENVSKISYIYMQTTILLQKG